MKLLIAAVALLAGATLIAADAHADRAAVLKPPVIHEPFTLLPCPSRPQSTLDREGCAEHRIVRLDRQIDATARTIFARLADANAKQDFIAAQTAWLAYRRADCQSVSDKFEGGTEAGVLAATCTADRSVERLKDVKAFATLLQTP
jgi:uncharacterized protein YecT (DUF1311 family)